MAGVARLVEKHNGIFGGCWCISFHLEPGEKRHGYAAYKVMKRALVRQGRAHAALVFDGLDNVGWCQFGRTAELPNIRSKKAYEEGLGGAPGLAHYLLLHRSRTTGRRGRELRPP